jgi:CDP-diglyceride synthetase
MLIKQTSGKFGKRFNKSEFAIKAPKGGSMIDVIFGLIFIVLGALMVYASLPEFRVTYSYIRHQIALRNLNKARENPLLGPDKIRVYQEEVRKRLFIFLENQLKLERFLGKWGRMN